MGSVRSFAIAHRKAENRIVAHARKAWKPLRETSIKRILNGEFEFYDIDNLAKAFLLGMLTAYIFGRLAGYRGLMVKNTKKKFSEEGTHLEILNILLKRDKNIIKAIVGARIFKKIAEKDVFVELFRPSESASLFLENYTVQLARVEQEDTLNEVTKLVQETIGQGMSEREAIKYIEQNLKKFSERRIQMIARTEATRAYNIGTLEESFTSEIVKGYRFEAVLDMRTSPICRPRHGMFIPKNDTFSLATNTPPLHVNCRSRLVPVTTYDREPSVSIYDLSLPASNKRSADIEVVRGILGW